MLVLGLRRLRWLLLTLLALPLVDLLLGKLAATAGRRRPNRLTQAIQSLRTQVRSPPAEQHRRPGAPGLGLRRVTCLRTTPVGRTGTTAPSQYKAAPPALGASCAARTPTLRMCRPARTRARTPAQSAQSATVAREISTAQSRPQGAS